MTELTITPKVADKTARFKGTVAAGEHVAVTIKGGAEWMGDDLALRVLDLVTGRTLAVFPRPEEVLDEDESGDEWGTAGDDGADLYCELNLNTDRMVAAARHMLRVPVMFVLGDTGGQRTLYFRDRYEVEYWPERIGDTTPYNLDNWPKQMDDWADVVTRAAQSAENSASAAKAAQRAAELTPGIKGDKGDRGPKGDKGDRGEAALVTKMRERTGDRLWHDVALSQSYDGKWVMDVEQDAGGGGSFDADVVASGTTASRSLESRFAAVFDVKDFGAVGDGVADDTEAVRAAINAATPGSVVVFSKGVYKVTASISLGGAKNHVTIDGNGARIIWDKDPTSSSNWLFSAYGSIAKNSEAYSFGADAARGDINIETEDANPFVEGDWLFAQSQRDCSSIEDCGPDWVLVQPTGYDNNVGMLFGEPVQVSAKVEGSEGKGLALDSPLIFPSYETGNSHESSPYCGEGSTLRKMVFLDGLVIRGFNVTVPIVEDANNPAGFVRMSLCKDCIVEDVAVSYDDFSPGQAVLVSNCLACEVRSVHVKRPPDSVRDLSIDHSQYNSFVLASSWYCSFVGCTDENGMQSFDATAWIGANDDFKAQGPSLWTTFDGCKVLNAHEQSYVSHSGCYGITIKNCESYRSPVAVYMRSGPLHVTGCVFVGRYPASGNPLIDVSEGDGDRGNAFTNTSIGIYLWSDSRYTRGNPDPSNRYVDNAVSLFGSSMFSGNRIDGFSFGAYIYTATCKQGQPHKYFLNCLFDGNLFANCLTAFTVRPSGYFTCSEWDKIKSGLRVSNCAFFNCVNCVDLRNISGAEVCSCLFKGCGPIEVPSYAVKIVVANPSNDTVVRDNTFSDIRSPESPDDKRTVCIFTQDEGFVSGNRLNGESQYAILYSSSAAGAKTEDEKLEARLEALEAEVFTQS